MNKALVAHSGKYAEAKAIESYHQISQQKNWYIVEATVRILVDDDLDRINSQIMLERRVQDECQTKVISFKILDEEHFSKTHYYDFGYHRTFLGKVEDENSGEYYYQKQSSSSEYCLEKINHETIDGDDWIIGNDYRVKIHVATKETFREDDNQIKMEGAGLIQSRKSLR
jgi:hypothetical protein